MAVDKLVDSTQLDADLTAVANAIRTKGGTSAQLSFPNGMTQAIADIPSGGGDNPFEFAKILAGDMNLWSVDSSNKRTIKISSPVATDISGFAAIHADYIGYSLTTLIIDIPQQNYVNSHTFKNLNYSNGMFILDFPRGFRYGGQTYIFYDIKNVKEINGEIDMSGAVSIGVGCMQRPNNLEKIFFKPNSARVMFSFNEWGGAPNLKNEAIISIANGLNETATEQSLVLHATPKAKCSTIMGTVAMDETNTYHIFTADENGDTTLAEFITTVKGWTLA